MKKQDIKVDFDNSILALSNSLLHHFGVHTDYKSLPVLDSALAQGYKNVVLLILDCLGKNILEKHLAPTDFLRQHKVADISSIFPPTTAAATIAYHSGLPPIASGWLGWMNYFEQYNRVIENFRNIDFYTGEKLTTPHPAETVLKYETIYEKILKQNPDMEYHKIFPAFEAGGTESFDELCTRIEEATSANNKRKIIAAYWTEPDHTIHEYGIGATEVTALVQAENERLAQMATHLKDTLVIISADHGALDVEEKIMNEHQDLCDTFRMYPTIETRFISFFIKNGEGDKFVRLFNQYYGSDFVLYTKEELLQSHILGYGRQHPLIEKMLGDYFAVGFGNLSLNYDSGRRALELFKATHAGYSPQEMTVPLILLKCKKKY
ncbi:MAG: alkaline phosphatase family protein [Alphaproteobacteria bacterium]|nr:alkaline phosphatase family protein [Alphaproteobacteria bacterium]